GRDAHVGADSERSARIQAAVSIDPGVGPDGKAVAPDLSRPVEPDVAPEVNARTVAELHPEDATVPGAPQREARDVADRVVGHVVEEADDEQPRGAESRACGRLLLDPADELPFRLPVCPLGDHGSTGAAEEIGVGAGSGLRRRTGGGASRRAASASPSRVPTTNATR